MTPCSPVEIFQRLGWKSINKVVCHCTNNNSNSVFIFNQQFKCRLKVKQSKEAEQLYLVTRITLQSGYSQVINKCVCVWILQINLIELERDANVHTHILAAEI